MIITSPTDIPAARCNRSPGARVAGATRHDVSAWSGSYKGVSIPTSEYMQGNVVDSLPDPYHDHCMWSGSPARRGQ